MTNKAGHNLFESRGRGFTMVEVVAAVMILSIILSSVMFLMNRYLEAVVDMRLQQRAFEVARANMETLLAVDKLSDMSEFGESELYPDIQWSTTVEPYTLPVKDRMWIRAVCSAGYIDSQGERQSVELEHWITSLTGTQIKQILNQQEAMGEYYDLIKEGFMTDTQLATLAFLEDEEMPVAEYRELVETHRRQKLEYINEMADKFDQKKYDDLAEKLDEEENEFLDAMGIDFDKFNEFAMTYVPPPRPGDSGDSGPDDSSNIDDGDSSNPDETPDNEPEEYQWDWDKIPKELWGLIESLTGAKPPY
ncbi:MAG: type IV pilus modification PilV family protein [Planctomycetota bacterium]